MVLLAKLLRVLAIGAELSPGLLTYGFCMGLFLGFMPTGATEFSLVLAFLLIAFTRQSWGFMMATAGVVKAAMAAGLWRPVAATGRAVLEAGALQGLWANVLDWPVLRLLQLERYPAMGGLVWTLALSLVLGFPIYKSMSWMQTSLLPKLPRIPILGWMLRMLFFGVRPIAAVTGPSAEPVDVNKTIAIQPDGVDDETNDTPAALKEPLSKRPPAVRWFVFIPTVVAAIVFELVFGASLLDYITRKAASASVGVQLWLQETNLSLTRGIVGYKKIKAEQETTGEVTKDLASVEAATVNVNVAHLLKGALTVEEARVTNPEFRYVRGEEKTEAAPADPKIAEEIRKKLEDEDFMNSVLEKVQQKYDEWKKSQPAEESKTPDPSKPEPAQVAEAAPLSEADKALLGRASYMSERPLVWLQSLICDGLSLKIEDKIAKSSPIGLVDGHVEITNLTTHPRLVEKPFGLIFTARLAEHPQSAIRFTVGHSFAQDYTTVSAELERIPMELVDPLFRKSLAIRFGPGTLGTFKLNITIRGEVLDIQPVIGFEKLNCSARNPGANETVGGVQAEKLSKELNNIGELQLSDIRIGGTYMNPTIDWGNSIEQLVIQGATNYAKNQANAALNKGTERANAELEKGMGKLDEKAEKYGIKPSEILKGTEDTTKSVGEGAGKVLDDAAKTAGGMIGDLLGGKKDEKKEDVKPETQPGTTPEGTPPPKKKKKSILDKVIGE